MKTLAIIALTLGTPVLADCPAAPDITAQMDDLLAQMQTIETDREAREISNQMWEVWIEAPDDAAQTLLDEGMDRRAVYDLEGAVTAFDALVEYCPDYAEGYNQRAFANFLREDFATALPDLDRALELSPRHVAAMSGKGLTLIQMGRIREGQDVIREALKLNPWLSERQFLALPPETTDL
ncbi:tetratricopeptide repeat protein [Jannaschia pohangensis]|uniref:Uncharacterized protein n=1 Tax=Jannaschia pohangensis TaxID=390807 RepID=A0A1I3MVA4_9RHOB|nr:hypothetical protein [Jannaschia pohangensis]SFJ00917.1 hypothetical protein SAMN04488095_1968 [Jannaschia pohangensis]